MARLNEKVILVSGATSGIGAVIARRCVEEGATVVLSGVEQQAGEDLAAQLGEPASFVALDVTSEEDWRSAVAAVVARHGRLDVLVNNAGVMAPADVESTTSDMFDGTFAVNSKGVFLGCQAAIAQMKQQGSPATIVNTVSTTALKTSAWTMAYGASKAAALSITKSVALHCAEQKYQVRCNAVLPGVVLTPMVQALVDAAPDKEEALAGLTATHPIGRLIEPEEVANGIIYFASDESSGVTGAELVVDGGLTAG